VVPTIARSIIVLMTNSLQNELLGRRLKLPAKSEASNGNGD